MQLIHLRPESVCQCGAPATVQIGTPIPAETGRIVLMCEQCFAEILGTERPNGLAEEVTLSDLLHARNLGRCLVLTDDEQGRHNDE